MADADRGGSRDHAGGGLLFAFLGRLHPVGILLAGLLMALTYIEGELAQSNMQLPAVAIPLIGPVLFSHDPLVYLALVWGCCATAAPG